MTLAISWTPRERSNSRPAQDFSWVQQDTNLFKSAVQAYLAASSLADDCVGQVLDALEKSPARDNTIVVIWGDHGWHLGEKLRFRKATLWAESTRLPLTIRVPGMKGAAGLSPPGELDRSLSDAHRLVRFAGQTGN